ncbi:MAG: helix-turn-helix transcriptional regulator [Bryobacterales bacterium]|nr:helix-turn-helix transcriptional regulator [Bryobacterales bacterium]
MSELARLAGISQPHMHHILLGRRGLQPTMADRLATALSLDIPALVELEAARRSPAETDGSGEVPIAWGQKTVLVPLFDGLIGHGYPAPERAHPPKYLPVPRSEMPPDCALCAARLAHDPALAPGFLGDDLLVIALSPLPTELQKDLDGLPRVVTTGGSWRVLLPDADPDSGRRVAAAFKLGSAGEAGLNQILVGVVVLTIRQMRPLRFMQSR